MSSKLSAFVAIALIALPITLWSPGASAQAGFATRFDATRQASVSRAIPTEKLCFWRLETGAPFGASGTCRAGASAQVGAPCACTWNREHYRFVRHGTVIEVEQGAPSSPLH